MPVLRMDFASLQIMLSYRIFKEALMLHLGERNGTPAISGKSRLVKYYPPENMIMENQPSEDVSPIKNGDFPLSC